MLCTETCLAAKSQVMDMFQEARLGKAVDPSTTLPLVGEIAASVLRQPHALISVARIKTHDDYTYLHSVAVCALMLSLARHLDSDEEQTRLAGIGGLMHDLGKAAMPLEVLNKPGKLTDAEFAIMKRHPVEGAKMLRAGGPSPGWWTLPCTITRRSTEPATRIAWPVTPFHSWPAWAQSATSMMP